MINYTTEIDTIGLQIDLATDQIQRETLLELLNYISKMPSVYIGQQEHLIASNINRIEHILYCNNTTLATISTGTFKARRGAHFITMFYITIKFAGLKTYHDQADRASYESLLRVCAYFNAKNIPFKFTELDLCIDIACPYDHVLAVCTKKSPKTHYYGLVDSQVYTSTTYIEQIQAKKRDKAVLRAYTYDKSLKENLSYAMTRFEVKLQPKYFNKHGFSMPSIEKVLARYHLMYFDNLQEKYEIIEAYNNYQHVRKREIRRLNFEKYRLYANMHYIENFIHRLLTVDEYDIYSMSQYSA